MGSRRRSGHFIEPANWTASQNIGECEGAAATPIPSGSRPSFSLPARENIVVPGGDLHALRLDPAGEVVHLFHRFSREQRVLDLPSLAAAARGAAHRAIEAVRGRGRRHLRTPA